MRWGGWEMEDHGGDGGAQRALWWDDIWAKTKDKNEPACEDLEADHSRQREVLQRS